MPGSRDIAFRRKGRLVTLAGFTLNSAMGVLFTWSMFARDLSQPVSARGYGWSQTAAAFPYALAIAMFALVMIPAGRLQDRFGSRAVAVAGAVLCGAGLLVAGRGGPDSSWPIILGFGLLTGTGIGFGYAAATPAAIKWFGPEKKGLITGIVISGFGLAPVYLAPLSETLIESRGVAGAFDFLGILFLGVAGISATFLVSPARSPKGPTSGPSAGRVCLTLFRKPRFRSLYFQMACAATAGLMIIGHIVKIAETQSAATVQTGSLLVAVLAVFNALGRVTAGRVSDLIGRSRVMITVFLAQTAVMFLFTRFSSLTGLLFGAAAVGFNYGACLSLFPATVADLWGIENLGINYGLLFTAWGIGGVFGPSLAGRIADAAGNYRAAFLAAAGLLLLAAALAVRDYIRPRRRS